MPTNDRQPRLQSIACVTYAVPDLDASRDAFIHHLEYQAVLDGQLPVSLAKLWRAAKSQGNRFTLLQPASGEAVYIRLVETPVAPGYAPLKHFGWNAAELHVQDIHLLAQQLQDSPFRIIGGPRDLLDNGAVVALQVLGPGDELLYLTQINHEGMNATYGKAQSPVDRVFIAVLGCRRPEASTSYYAQISERTTVRKAFNIRVLANAHGLDPLATTFDISSAVFGEPFRIEMDAYPTSASPKPQLPDALPPGLAILTVTARHELASFLQLTDELTTGPDEAPYHGRPVVLLQGPDGEYLELILESPDVSAHA